MKILLIKPPQDRRAFYHIIPPLGLGYIASSLKRLNVKVDIIDCLGKNFRNRDLFKYIKDQDPDIIGFTTYTHDLNNIKVITSYIRNEMRSRVTIVVGGPHPSSCPEHTLNYLSQVDFAFKGEAEIGFSMLVEYLQRFGLDNKLNIHSSYLSQIPGLIYRQGQKYIRVNSQCFLDDLDSLGFVYWDLIKPQNYFKSCHGVFFKSTRFAPIFATRGCPKDCYFCASHNIMGKKIRRRSVRHIVDEIKYLRNNFKINEFHFLDDNFTSDRKFVMTFCKTLLEENINIYWSCPNGVRIDTLDEEMLDLMKQSGCYSIFVGLESGSQYILNEMQKGLGIPFIRDKVRLIKEKKFNIAGFFILGYPGETKEHMIETIKFAKALPLDIADFSNFLPLPGTPIYQRLFEEGKLNKINFESICSPANIVTIYDGIKEKKMRRKMIRKAYFEFYLRPKILIKLLSKVKSKHQIYFIFKRLFDYLIVSN